MADDVVRDIPEETPDERLPGFRYFNGHDGERWRVHPPRVEYFDYGSRRWVTDTDLTVEHLEMPGGDAVEEERPGLRPVRSFFPEGWEAERG